MLTEALVREHLQAARENLSGWREPDGYLVPTEPDPEERARVRARLEVAIATYQRVLGEEQPPARRVSVRG